MSTQIENVLCLVFRESMQAQFPLMVQVGTRHDLFILDSISRANGKDKITFFFNLSGYFILVWFGLNWVFWTKAHSKNTMINGKF